MQNSDVALIVFLILLIIIGIAILLTPYFIAKKRKNHYKLWIFALCILGGWTIVGWFIALFWSLAPNKTLLIDPLTGSLTGNPNDPQVKRTMPFTSTHKKETESSASLSKIEMLEKLHSLKEKGIITEDELLQQKSKIME